MSEQATASRPWYRAFIEPRLSWLEFALICAASALVDRWWL